MKRITKYILLISMALGVGACDFLEVDPIGKTTIPVFFSDMEGIRAALPGTYSAVYDYYSAEFMKYPEVAGNMARLNIVGGSADMINQYNFTSDASDETEAVGYIWRRIYVAMANINNIIEYQPALLAKFPKQKDELDRIMAEALYLRALAHFDVVRVYAQPYNYSSDASHLGIPILSKTPGADDHIGRKSVKEVYTQVIADLQKSIELFGDKADRGIYYASRNAAYALLSRVYLYMENWDKVVEYSGMMIQKYPLSQSTDYIDMYINMGEGKESIFRLNGTKKKSALATFYSPAAPVAFPADTLINLFDNPADIRLSLLTDEKGSHVCRKYYIAKQVAEVDKHYDPFVSRVSEMYLNRAEAYLNKNMLTEAAADLKAIIARSLKTTVDKVVLNTANKAELTRVLEKERAKELCFEGHQFFDITRKKQSLVREKGTNSSVRKLNYPSDYFVLPIPLKELETNPNMKPNPTVN